MSVSLNGSPQVATFRLPILKVTTKSRLQLTLRTDAVVYVATHWLGGRTLLCADDAQWCPGCAANQARLTGYTVGTAVDGRGERLVLVEIAGTAACDYFMGLPSPLAGLTLEVTRPSARHAVQYRCNGRAEDMYQRNVDGFRLLQALSVLFDVPLPRPGQTPSDWIEATRDRRVALLQDAARR